MNDSFFLVGNVTSNQRRALISKASAKGLFASPVRQNRDMIGAGRQKVGKASLHILHKEGLLITSGDHKKMKRRDKKTSLEPSRDIQVNP